MSRPLLEALRKLPRGFLGMLPLLLACEMYFAGHDLKFSRMEAEDWKSAARMATGGLPSGGVLIFGDSQVKFGVSPLLLESKLGQPSQCLAIQSGQASTSYFLLKRALASGVIPSAVVVDFEPHLLNARIDHNMRTWSEFLTLPECFELASAAGSPEAFAKMVAGSILTSYRARLDIRDNLMDALKGRAHPMATSLEMFVRNKGMNRGALAIAAAHDGQPRDATNWGNPTPTPWAPDRVNDAYARKFVRLCREINVPVYCLVMPVAPALREKFRVNGMDEQYFAWLRKLQAKNPNLYVLNYRDSGYGDGSFTDAIHLNVEGSLSVTAALGDHIKRAYRGENIDRRWVGMPGFRTDGIEIAVEDSNTSNAVMINTLSRRR